MQHSHTIRALADYRQGVDHSSAHSAQVHVRSQTSKEKRESFSQILNLRLNNLQ